jgi:hypothetical protein
LPWDLSTGQQLDLAAVKLDWTVKLDMTHPWYGKHDLPGLVNVENYGKIHHANG